MAMLAVVGLGQLGAVSPHVLIPGEGQGERGRGDVLTLPGGECYKWMIGCPESGITGRLPPHKAIRRASTA